MRQIKQLHHKAMALVDEAERARLAGNSAQAGELLRQAFDCERSAAALAAADATLEPTRSVLHRSAASLALECKEFREAERLISVALAGSPPDVIIEELRDLLEQVYFERHLQLRGISLEAEEVQLSIAGRAVGAGMVLTEEFLGRVRAFEKLIYRTAERQLGIPYREQSVPNKDVRDSVELFVSAPRVASFAVSLRLGRPHGQRLLPFADGLKPKNILDEILDSLGRFVSGHADVVQERISSDSYYRNFVALARQLAPDGNKVSMVGLTVVRKKKQESLALTQTKRQLPTVAHTLTTGSDSVQVAITGSLLFADATGVRSGRIKVVDDSGVDHLVLVPEGMMSDIVRPLWDQLVTVEGVQTRQGLQLIEIRKAE